MNKYPLKKRSAKVYIFFGVSNRVFDMEKVRISSQHDGAFYMV